MGKAAIAESLRNQLADHLRDRGTVRTERVEAAVRVVPRHEFVPAVSLHEAYPDELVCTKHDGAGTSISAPLQLTARHATAVGCPRETGLPAA